MSEVRPDSVETVSILMGGFGTFKENPFSTPMYEPYKHLADKNTLIDPHWFGIQPFDELAKCAGDRIKQLREDYNTQRLIIIGHSLGGLVGMDFVIKNPELIDGFMSIGTPYGRVTPLVAPFDMRGKERSRIRDELEDGVSDTTDIRLVGSDKDGLVPMKSALPQTPHARYRITDSTSEPIEGVTFLPLEDDHSGHNGMPLHSHVLELARVVANSGAIQKGAAS